MGSAHAPARAGSQGWLVKFFEGWDWDTPAVAEAWATSKARGADLLAHAACDLPALPCLLGLGMQGHYRWEWVCKDLGFLHCKWRVRIMKNNL